RLRVIQVFVEEGPHVVARDPEAAGALDRAQRTAGFHDRTEQHGRIREVEMPRAVNADLVGRKRRPRGGIHVPDFTRQLFFGLAAREAMRQEDDSRRRRALTQDEHAGLLQSDPRHVSEERAADIDRGFTTAVAATGLDRRSAAEGVPEDAETRDVQAPKEPAARVGAQAIDLVDNEDDVFRPDHYQPVGGGLLGRARPFPEGGLADAAYHASVREYNHGSAVRIGDSDHDVAV